MNHQNPFAPPQAIELSHPPDSNAPIYRNGDLLVIQDGAQMPRICLVSGQATSASFDWITAYAPRWHYSLLLFGILPYFIIGPFLIRSIRIKLPCSPELIERINRRNILVKGLNWAGLGTLLFGSTGIESDWGTIIICGCAIIAFVIAAMLRKDGNLLGLKVVKLSGSQLWLSGVHPNVLSELPEY